MFRVFGHLFTGERKLGIKITDDLDLIQCYHITFFILPIYFQRRILLYNFSKNKYYDLDDKLEDRLLKIGKNPDQREISQIIRQYEKEEKNRTKYYKEHKEELEEKDNWGFVKFLKTMGMILLILFSIFLIRWIFF